MLKGWKSSRSRHLFRIHQARTGPVWASCVGWVTSFILQEAPSDVSLLHAAFQEWLYCPEALPILHFCPPRKSAEACKSRRPLFRQHRSVVEIEPQSRQTKMEPSNLGAFARGVNTLVCSSLGLYSFHCLDLSSYSLGYTQLWPKVAAGFWRNLGRFGRQGLKVAQGSVCVGARAKLASPELARGQGRPRLHLMRRELRSRAFQTLPKAPRPERAELATLKLRPKVEGQGQRDTPPVAATSFSDHPRAKAY
jgi:hypothetical protein